MKVQTNIRAGRQTQNRGSSMDSSSTSSSDVVVVYVPPVSRCVGL